MIIDREDVPVNTKTIFHRIALINKADEQFTFFFNYKLAPYPLSLLLYDLFTPLIAINLEVAAIVIAGLCGRMMKHFN